MSLIQEIRKTAGMSQAAFADSIGVTQSSVSQYERGVIRLDVDRAQKVIDLAKRHGRKISLGDLYQSKPKEISHV